MRATKITLFLCLALLLGACKGKTSDNSVSGKEIEQEVMSDHNMVGMPKTIDELKANFMGTFSGILPCADCEGILTTLTLNADGTYTLESIYQGKGDNKFVDQGKWTPSEDLAVIQLNYDKEGETVYYALIDKDTLEKLDMDAKPIISDLNYKLVRK